MDPIHTGIGDNEVIYNAVKNAIKKPKITYLSNTLSSDRAQIDRALITKQWHHLWQKQVPDKLRQFTNLYPILHYIEVLDESSNRPHHLHSCPPPKQIILPSPSRQS